MQVEYMFIIITLSYYCGFLWPNNINNTNYLKVQYIVLEKRFLIRSPLTDFQS